MGKELWEILVPTTFPDGEEIPLYIHQIWDKEIKEITGGLSIFKTVKGQWFNKNGYLYIEEMIPVRIACNQKQMKKIAKITMAYYQQEAVMYYQITDKCFIMEKKDE